MVESIRDAIQRSSLVLTACQRRCLQQSSTILKKKIKQNKWGKERGKIPRSNLQILSSHDECRNHLQTIVIDVCKWTDTQLVESMGSSATDNKFWSWRRRFQGQHISSTENHPAASDIVSFETATLSRRLEKSRAAVDQEYMHNWNKITKCWCRFNGDGAMDATKPHKRTHWPLDNTETKEQLINWQLHELLCVFAGRTDDTRRHNWLIQLNRHGQIGNN